MSGRTAEEFLKSNEKQICSCFAKNPDVIIDKCEDILTVSNSKDLGKEIQEEKICNLLRIIIQKGEDHCQKLKDILKSMEKEHSDLQKIFQNSSQVSSRTAYADGNSMVYDQSLINIRGKDLNMHITLPSNSAGCSSLSGQPPPRADAVAVNKSIIHAGVIRDSTFDGDVNISVGGSPQIITVPPKGVKQEYSSKGSAMTWLKQQKINLIECLQTDANFILQFLHSHNIVTEREYRRLKDATPQENAVIDMIDVIIGKNEEKCNEFHKILKLDKIMENYPNLHKFIGFESPTEAKTKGTSSILDALGFLKEKHSQLVSRVKNIGPILDDMQVKGLHPEMAATVSAQLTPQLMMRKLLEATNSTKAADMLVTALLQHEPHLMEDLK